MGNNSGVQSGPDATAIGGSKGRGGTQTISHASVACEWMGGCGLLRHQGQGGNFEKMHILGTGGRQYGHFQTGKEQKKLFLCGPKELARGDMCGMM